MVGLARRWRQWRARRINTRQAAAHIGPPAVVWPSQPGDILIATLDPGDPTPWSWHRENPRIAWRLADGGPDDDRPAAALTYTAVRGTTSMQPATDQRMTP